jgi:hypothetical protein
MQPHTECTWHSLVTQRYNSQTQDSVYCVVRMGWQAWCYWMVCTCKKKVPTKCPTLLNMVCVLCLHERLVAIQIVHVLVNKAMDNAIHMNSHQTQTATPTWKVASNTWSYTRSHWHRNDSYKTHQPQPLQKLLVGQHTTAYKYTMVNACVVFVIRVAQGRTQ